MFRHEQVSHLILVGGAALGLGAPQSLIAQTIHGRLLEQITEKPIPNAAVSLIAVPEKTLSDTKTNGIGEFTLKAPSPGTFRLRAVVNGYRTVVSPALALQRDDEVSLTMHIMPDTIYLLPVLVTANSRQSAGRLDGLSDRKKRSIGGQFITREDIDRRRPFKVTDLLTTVPGIRLIPGLFGDDVVTSEGCRPAIYLDGVRFPLVGEKLDNIVNPQEIEAIEVYAHVAEVPPEFMSAGQQCGAIAIWTRVGG